MSYRNLSSAVSVLFLALCLTLVLLPEIVYWLFSIQGNELGNFLAKRAGVLFLGLSILCYYSRNTKSKEVRCLVARSVGTAMAAMAFIGLYELIRGTTGFGILIAVVIEVAIAALYFRIWSGREAA